MKATQRMTVVGLLAMAAGRLAAGGDCQVPSNETCSGQIVFSSDDLPFSDVGLIG
jgi:hypothetical protein